MSAFPISGNQIARFPEWAAHLILSVVIRKGQKREKSQFKIDQDFGRNRKMAEKGVIVILSMLFINHWLVIKILLPLKGNLEI